MQRADKIIIALVLTGLLAWVLWEHSATRPAISYKTVSEGDLDQTIIGDSADNSSADGPAYMGANWAPPMPLSLWNPASTLRAC